MSEKSFSAGKIFTEADFLAMSWHDCRVYGIEFPREDFNFKFSIDYIFDWIKKEDGGCSGFLVAPCELMFFNVTDFEISIFQNRELTFSIDKISRENERLTPNGKLTEWRYIVQLENGVISFSATGYSMRVLEDARVSSYQDLGRA